jgi:ABC-type multidrug transport system fused ATPase/permease subunit
LDQSKFLFLLCILYLVVVLASALIKYLLNVAKGYVSERFGRRLRVLIYRKWCRDSTRERKAEIIPIVGQEVEALGGFAGEVITLPLLQGGTLVTVILFMLMQDPVLGIAALTVAPVQIILLPRLQRRVNEQSRARLKKVRSLGVELGDQLVDSAVPKTRLRIIAGLFRDLENIRRRVYRMKFFNKALNNVLTSLTPFFFFSLGGYFVLQDRISLGALVAVLAAHKEFSSPMNELFAYYQMVEDTRLRYREVHHYFDRHSTRVAESGSADNPDTWGVLTVRS